MFAAACEPVACTTAPVASDAQTLIARIDATATWVGFGEYTSGCLPASEDMPVTGTITIDGGDIALPTNCAGCPAVGFVLRDEPPGVECLDPENFFDFALCRSVRITDTTVRLRPMVRDVHPAPGNHRAIVEVLPACATPCAAEAFTCEAVNTCWATARDHCAYCLGGSNDACACWDGSDFMADGTACQRHVSGDVIVGGTCQQGVCVD